MANSSNLDFNQLAQRAVDLAADILSASRDKETSQERSRSAMMARMMRDEPGKKFTLAMADQVLRINRPARAADRMNRLIGEYGVPKYFSGADQAALRIGNQVADWLPKTVMPQVKKRVRKDSEHVIISAEDKEFSKYLSWRKEANVRVNFNQLGEAVLGDHEAERRLRDNIKRLIDPGVDYISIKLSAIASQISLIGYQQTIEEIKPRLRAIYRAAISGGGPGSPKFVNLDMEEYRDLHLTVDVFKLVMDEPEFDKFEAGIVLQAYLPDSYIALQDLTEWAKQRKQRTGTGIKIRLVKGANLAMEQVEAAREDWPQAPYGSKLEVDANYKRMLEFACQPENAAAIRIGVGSHNLFDIAFAMLLRNFYDVESQIEFEMLEGMANAQAEEIRQRTGGMLVYAPVVMDAEFEAAIAYLVRRLDENTAPGSFLGALFALREGTAEWEQQKNAFLAAVDLALDPELSTGPNRIQNRLTESPQPQPADQPFRNEPNTDFSLPANRTWAEQIMGKWKNIELAPIPIQIGGQFQSENLTGKGKDPSRPMCNAYTFCQANRSDIETALKTAVEAQPGWEKAGVAARGEILRKSGAVMAAQRGDTIGAMLLDAGKNIREADVEISEAVDFANYYALSLDEPGWDDGTSGTACGVVVVTPPWNFPYAIPAGGVLAALAGGNTVILKPARESVLTAWMLVQQLWEAGVPKDVLQFAPTVNGETGKALVADKRVGAVILTGSVFTAQMFQSWRAGIRLYAETSGKNSLVVTAAADLDLAIKDLVLGAFGHAGQKCSATSLALVEKEVYDSPKFIQQLKDAAESLKIGGSWDPSATVTPVIRKPDQDLEKGLTQLQDGESWLVEPKMIDSNPCHWSPGIRMGVKPGSWYHTTECFGPVLGIIRVENFEHAIEIQNSSEFGLTGGLHSLDPKEIAIWREKVEVGNAYINRSTTGAIVRRQPFGGWKDSCVGLGHKAGGPSYVSTFLDWAEDSLPTLSATPASEVRSTLSRLCTWLGEASAARLKAAAESYAFWWDHEFVREHDPSQIHGETNDFRYRARPWHLIRFHSIEDMKNFEDPALIALACQTAGLPLMVSVPEKTEEAIRFAKSIGVNLEVESADQLAVRLKGLRGGTMRIFGAYDATQFSPSEIGNLPILRPSAMANGRVELLNYLREQAISETVHRYGNIFD
ncbi:MAG: RHH-type proline utilization regulon transcriptional repressor/proline dehydrogenase [Mariniblastus sp.]|jgi:RHH-type proline utilization regulon transcriptional repressor/proline dehydrogenase/delta 1-pyrroline-5-carboxylate dehydrogenase